MKKKIGWILLAAAMVILLGAAGALYEKYSGEVENQNMMTEEASKAEIREDSTEEPAEELAMAPDFTVYDGEGNEVKLSDFIGKPVVVNFWASWCGPCQMEMPDFEENYLENGEKVQFLMVNMTDGAKETLESAKKFVKESGYTFPVCYDTQMDAAMSYGVNSIPSTYFIDGEGHAIARAAGMIDAETLQYGIEMILGE